VDISAFVQQAKDRISRVARAFEGCDALEGIITELLPPSLPGASTSAARAAIATLFAKALKSFNGVRILAAFGYGEDALIVTRALLNLSFVAGYICAKDADSEERAFAWIANGHIAQRDFIERDLGLPLPDDLVHGVDWKRIEEYTHSKKVEPGKIQEAWPRKVKDIAKGAGMEELYTQAYRFMSSPEHSDAWGVNTYIHAWDETGLHLKVNPSDDRVTLALEIAAQAMANVLVKFCDTFEIPYSVERIGQIGSYFGDEEEDEGTE
jgi:hypothetical protein